MKQWIALVAICLTVPLLLTGCVAAGSDSPTIRTLTVRRPVCPALKVYTAADQARAADVLEHLPRDDPLAPMIVDYGQLREALRKACTQKRS